MKRRRKARTIALWATVDLLIVCLTLNAREATADQVISDDLIVQSSLCVGQDCVPNETFGFDTLRFKENNLRIDFDDTSSAGNFPLNDWGVTINDSENGGMSRFSIDDRTNLTTPLTIEAGAPSHSLYVDGTGRVGLGTSMPQQDLQITTDDTPMLSLDQTHAAGWPAQRWIIGANESRFYLYDMTHNRRMVNISARAPDNSIFLAPGGNLGLGTSAPATPLEIVRTADPVAIGMRYGIDPNDAFDIVADGTGLKIQSRADPNVSIQLASNGNVQLGDTGRFVWNAGTRVASIDGSLAVAGGWYATSSRASKHEIRPVDTGAVLDKLVALPVAEWSYIEPETDVRHLGPMAEDFRAAFQLGKDERHINLLDAVGVTIAAVQGMYTRLAQQNAELMQKNADLEARLAAIEAAIGTSPGLPPAPAPCAAAVTSGARTHAGAF